MHTNHSDYAVASTEKSPKR